MAREFETQIEDSRKRLAKCLNLLEAIHDDLEYVFEQKPEWNPEIKWQIEEGVVKLGFALATFTDWYDDEEPEEQITKGGTNA